MKSTNLEPAVFLPKSISTSTTGNQFSLPQSLSVTMNINMEESERMSPDLMGPGLHQDSLSPSHEEPRDLSIKRKVRRVLSALVGYIMCDRASYI